MLMVMYRWMLFESNIISVYPIYDYMHPNENVFSILFYFPTFHFSIMGFSQKSENKEAKPGLVVGDEPMYN